MDHFVTAFSQQIRMHNFKEGIDATINTLTDKLELTGSLNGQNFSFPNVPLWLSTNIDAKFDTITQLSFDWGFMRKFANGFLSVNISIMLTNLQICVR